jgi:basic membrane lipoprotein Med (substrate-binding protein (PBP1-ABC) superfamily)
MRTRNIGVAALLVALAAAAISLAVGIGSGTAAKTSPYKVAWIYPGPHNDHGWSQAHDVGRLYVQKTLGSKVQTTYKEIISTGPQLDQTVATLVQQGYKMIFGTSYGYFSKQLAAKYPDVLFEQATMIDTSKNLAEYFGAGEDTIYLSGMAAGAATKKGVLGYVVPFATPEVIRHTNAWALGAQSMHPGAKVKIVWTSSWLDIPKETRAAQSLHSAGADVLGQNVDSPATGQYAESAGIPWVGYDSDAKSFAPQQWLTAAVYHWGPYYLRRVKAAIAGTWKPGFYYGSINDGFTSLAPFGPKVTAKTKSAIAAKLAALKNHTFHVFSGPIYDQNGKLRVPKGTTLTLKQLYAMNWLVKGVIGSPKG